MKTKSNHVGNHPVVGVGEILIGTALAQYRADAIAANESAGYAGAMGCSHMLAVADAYQCGREGKTPDFLEPYIKEARRQTDPEYAEFVRLKSKFESNGL